MGRPAVTVQPQGVEASLANYLPKQESCKGLRGEVSPQCQQTLKTLQGFFQSSSNFIEQARSLHRAKEGSEQRGKGLRIHRHAFLQFNGRLASTSCGAVLGTGPEMATYSSLLWNEPGLGQIMAWGATFPPFSFIRESGI